MNFRLAQPPHLVDIKRLDELDYIRSDDGWLAIGARARQSALERSPVAADRCPLLVETVAQVGHPPIRHQGTVCGSVAHADPAAELCTVALALDATIVARSQRGARTVPIDEFFRGPFTTALQPDELLTEIGLAGFPAGAGWAFEEVARRRGDFAMLAVAAVLQVDAARRITHARLAYTSMGPTPLRAPRAEAWLMGQPASPDTFVQAAEAAMGELEPGDDLHATREYRLEVGRALTNRALARALERAQ
jgi:carbon-monoxide dehydrogenase medium subunit